MIIYKALFFVTLTLGLFAQGQGNLSGTIIYKASYANTLIKKTNDDGIHGANELIKNASDVYATLNFNTKESSYRVDKKLKVDKVDKLNISYYFAGGPDLYYYHKDSLNLLQSNSTLGKKYLISRSVPNWTITKETKLIDGLLCIKAYSKNKSDDKEKIDATAWFSPDIPVSFGPMKYFGLPGLIIELQFSKITFIAQKITLKQNDVIIEKPPKAEILTPEEFAIIARKKTPSFFEN